MLIIDYKFKIRNKIQTQREINLSSIDINGYTLTFNCNVCQTSNKSLIKPYESGQSIDNLYLKNEFISKNELLQNKLVQTPSKGYEYLGELILWNTSALYEVKNCTSCQNNFIIIFGCGELQPSRESLLISGIWNIEKVN